MTLRLLEFHPNKLKASILKVLSKPIFAHSEMSIFAPALLFLISRKLKIISSEHSFHVMPITVLKFTRGLMMYINLPKKMNYEMSLLSTPIRLVALRSVQLMKTESIFTIQFIWEFTYTHLQGEAQCIRLVNN